MNNLNSILDYLKVFNNINKRKAYEPRTMAQEPRIGLQGGQLVRNTVDGSRPGYGGPGSGAKKGSIPRQTSATKRATRYKKILENLPEGYFDEYVKNFYNEVKKTGKLTHVGGGLNTEKGIPYMENKYGNTLKETFPSMPKLKIKDVNAAIIKSIDDQIESGLNAGRKIRKADLEAIGSWYPKAPKGMATHHFLPKVAIEGTDLNYASSRNTAFISRELNSKMSPYDTKLKANQKKQIKLLNEKLPGWEKKIEDLNIKSRALVKNAAKEIPGSAGYLGFSEMKITSEGKPIFETRGIDYNKSLSGINEADTVIYKNISDADKIIVNKMSNIKSTNVLGKNFKEVVNNSKKGGALLTNNILNKSEKFKKVKICKTDFANGGGGLCGKAFAEADPQAYLEKVMKDQRLAGYLKSKEALTVGRSFLTKVAKVGSWANPLTLVGGEAWYSVLAGYNEWGKGASLNEAVNEGLWFIPGKHSRDLDILLGKDEVTKEGRNLRAISEGDRSQFDLLTQLGGLINEEGKLSGQLQMQKWYEADKQNESDRLLHASRFDFPTYKKNIAAQGRTDFFQDMASDINWSKTQITPQIEERLKNVMTEGEDVVQKYQAADPTGQSYPALQDKIKDFIVNKYNKGRTFDLADPYSGPVWNWMKRSFEQINHWSDDALTKRQEELDYLKLTGKLEDQSITKENIPPELIENFLTKFPEYKYVFEGAEGGIASLKKKW